MKQIFKNYYNNTRWGYYLFYIPKRIYSYINSIRMSRLTDEEFIQYKYKEHFNKEVNLKNPKSFTEKIQWLKLNDRKELYTQCADKYLVRNYVGSKIGSEYLIPLVFTTENYKEINQNNLPDYPVIIKTNHDSGGTFIIKDKKNVDFQIIQDELKNRLDKNFYNLNREWEYKNIKPRIIVEKLLQDNDENAQLNDYKIYCFHGKPKFIQTIFDRGVKTKEDWYDIDWNLLDAYYFSPNKKHVNKPKLFEELIKISEKLSQDIPYVRVDLYISKNKIYFGEMTFRPYGGFMKFIPTSFDIDLGKYLILKTEKEFE
jgi:hypothetical protein